MAGPPRGLVLLDQSTSAKRTKNQRDGFQYCVRIDSPNATVVAGAGTKRWTKLVIALRSEMEMRSWIAAIQSGVGMHVDATPRFVFDSSKVRAANMVVHQGTALKEVLSSNVRALLLSCSL